MAPPCTICQREDRPAVDAAIVGRRESIRAIALRLGVGKDALLRHRAAHISPALVRLAEGREERRALAGPTRVLDRVERLTDRLEELFEGIDSGATGPTLAVARELRAALELLAKLRGELKDGAAPIQVLNLMANPELQQVIAVVLDETAAHPEVRARIAARLRPPAGAISA